MWVYVVMLGGVVVIVAFVVEASRYVLKSR